MRADGDRTRREGSTLTVPKDVREHVKDWARREPWGRVAVYAALLVVTGASALLLFRVRAMTPTERAVTLIAAIVGWMLLVGLGWARGSLPLRPVVAAIAITLLCAVATPSRQSGDVYSYAMYGRIVTVYHENPYTTYPMHFEGDHMRRNVGELWQRTPDIYGVGFTAIMAALAPAIGESRFLANFAYQLLAAAAVAALLWLLWRRTRSPIALAFVGLHPLLSVSVVNGGHPDALIALGVFAGVFLALSHRVIWAAAAMAFAASINFTMIAAAVVLGVWAWRQWTRREVVEYSAIVGVFGVLPYLAVSGWLHTAHVHAEMISRQSLWTAVGGLISRSGPLSFVQLSRGEWSAIVSNGATVIAGILLLAILVRHTSRGTPEPAIAAAMAAVLVASAWVMPWYGFAALPLFALRKPNLLAWTVALYSALVLVGEQFPALTAGYIGGLTHQLLQYWVPVCALAACVAVIVFRPREVLTGSDALDVVAEPAPAAPAHAASA